MQMPTFLFVWNVRNRKHIDSRFLLNRLGENPIKLHGTKVHGFAGTFYIFENELLKNIISSVRNVFFVYLTHYSFHKNNKNDGKNNVQGKQRKHCEHSIRCFSVLYFRKYKKFPKNRELLYPFRGKFLIFREVPVL